MDSCALYCRISRDAEGEGVGVERQEVACRELAQRLNLTVVEVFTDNDIGASERTRTAKHRERYDAMLESVRAGKVRHIIAYSNSRLTRRMAELEGLIRLHDETGVQIHTVVSGEDDLSTADGRMIARIKASVDVAESDRLSERAKAAHRASALKGKPKLQRQRPFGWKADGVTLEPAEAALVREGVLDLARGIPLQAIRQRWMEQGVLTAAGNPEWHWQTIRNVLVGWRPAGIRTYQREPLYDTEGKLVRGTWEPIVTLDEREAALAQLGKRKITKQRQGKWLLTGIVRCECGSPMYGNLSYGRYPSTYVCRANGHVAIDAARLEKHVLLELYAHLANRALAGQVKTPEPKVQPWEGEARLEVVNRKIGELMEQFNSEQLSGEVVFPQVTKLEAERNQLRRERDAHFAVTAEPERQVQDAEDVARFIRDSDELEWEEKQAVLRQEADAIVISKGIKGSGGRSEEAFKKRVNIAWKPEHG